MTRGSRYKGKNGQLSQLPVHQALKAYQNAQNYFEHVTDPDLIDYAVYDMEAARKRYIYLLKMVQQGEEVLLREAPLREEAE